MSRKEPMMMEQKIEFITKLRSGRFCLTDLCRTYDISRPTAYKYILRYQQEGLKGLHERGRAPTVHPNKASDIIKEKIVECRKSHLRWGGEKI